MIKLVYLFQVFPVNVRVYLGGRDIRMPKEFLNRPEISASFQ
jgi:hypothetical protein